MGAMSKPNRSTSGPWRSVKRCWAREHPDTATSLNNLAVLYQAMGAYDQALPLYQRALEDVGKGPGPEHPYTATSLDNLGYLYRKLKDFGQAEGYFKQGRSKAGPGGVGPGYRGRAEALDC